MEDTRPHSNPDCGWPRSWASVGAWGTNVNVPWLRERVTELNFIFTSIFSNLEKEFFFKVLFSLQMSGMFENWLYKLVSALQMREKGANVVVVDWLPLAHQLYVDAVNNTRGVGLSIAQILDWLQVTMGLKGIISFSEKDLESEPF